VGLALACVVGLVLSIRPLYDTLGETIRHAAFQVSSIMTTTGYTTTDYDLWPSISKAILLLLMVVGACAGSTGGGLKCMRVLLLFKALRRNIRQILNPRKVLVVRSNDKVVDEKVLANTNAYLAAYVIIIVVSTLILSLDGFSFETNFTALAATINNIGPGLGKVGPAGSFGGFSGFSKIVLSFDMLFGRLEILPMLVLFTPKAWQRKA
jgi:trk system potassium uptake protein TrkH